MRANIPMDAVVIAINMRNTTRKGLSIRAIDAGVTFFFSTDPGELLQVDADTGTPQSGIPLTSASDPLIFPQFADVLYCRAAGGGVGVVGQIDLVPFNY